MNARSPADNNARQPLVDRHVDLRDYPYTPIFRTRLFASRFNNLASDAEWRAGVTLWLRSWDQVPAGSLPNDDRELAQLAGLGRDLRAWKKVRRWALYRWDLAEDGRLYHGTVAETVNHAWDLKLAGRRRTEAATEARRKNKGLNRDDKRDDDRNDQRDDDVTSTKRRKRKGESNLDLPSEPVAPRANGHDQEVEKLMEDDPVGRSAPLRRDAPPLKRQRKELLRQKIMRFVNATMHDTDRHAAHVGLMGEDQQHSAQWWLDRLDEQMRAQRWDDAQ